LKLGRERHDAQAARATKLVCVPKGSNALEHGDACSESKNVEKKSKGDRDLLQNH